MDSLQNQLNSLSQGKTTAASFYMQSACLSVSSGCEGNACLIILDNNGTTTIPAGYSVFIGVRDATKGTYFGFNTAVPIRLPPGQGVGLMSTSWPPVSNATAKLSPGDEVGVAVFVGSFEAAIGTHVLTCNQHPVTTTFLNYTSTQTNTWTTQTCT